VAWSAICAYPYEQQNSLAALPALLLGCLIFCIRGWPEGSTCGMCGRVARPEEHSIAATVRSWVQMLWMIGEVCKTGMKLCRPFGPRLFCEWLLPRANARGYWMTALRASTSGACHRRITGPETKGLACNSTFLEVLLENAAPVTVELMPLCVRTASGSDRIKKSLWVLEGSSW